MQPRRIFLLSPASSGGKRAALLFNHRAEFDIARRVRSKAGAPIGEVFSFLSGLYFRGKLTYARMFENPPPRQASGIYIITPTDGLCSPHLDVTLKDLERFATVPIEAEESRYRMPLERDAGKLAASGVELTYIPVSDPARLGIRATKKARAEADGRLEANV